jgi:branched-chain amino acid transport system ATP-binding protein
MLEIKDIVTRYGSVEALKGVSLFADNGEIVALIGANGAGKSTLLYTICGINQAAGGTIHLKGIDITKTKAEDITQSGISLVPEGRRIFAKLSVDENLRMGAYLRKDKKEIKRDMDFVYSLFPILAIRNSQQGGTLSGGEQQMLAISRALLARPSMILLDEPSLGLAPVIVKQIFDTLKKINAEQGTAILLVEQNARMALRISARAYVLETGRITLKGQSEDLANNEEVKKAYLGI